MCCVRLTQAEFGALHVLFNNAGVMLMDDDDAVRGSVSRTGGPEANACANHAGTQCKLV